MSNVYKCLMTETATVFIQADSEEQALNYIQTHTIQDVRNEAENGYDSLDMDYSEEVCFPVNGYPDVDISSKEGENAA